MVESEVEKMNAHKIWYETHDEVAVFEFVRSLLPDDLKEYLVEIRIDEKTGNIYGYDKNGKEIFREYADSPEGWFFELKNEKYEYVFTVSKSVVTRYRDKLQNLIVRDFVDDTDGYMRVRIESDDGSFHFQFVKRTDGWAWSVEKKEVTENGIIKRYEENSDGTWIYEEYFNGHIIYKEKSDGTVIRCKWVEGKGNVCEDQNGERFILMGVK